MIKQLSPDTIALLASRPVKAHLAAASEDLAAAHNARALEDWNCIIWRCEAAILHLENACDHAKARQALRNGQGLEEGGDHHAR